MTYGIKDYTYTEAEGTKMTPEEREGKLRCAQFVNTERPVYEGTNEVL